MSYYYTSANSSPTSPMAYYDYSPDSAQSPQQPRSQRPSGSYSSGYGGYPMSPTTSSSSQYSQYSQYSPTSQYPSNSPYDDYEPQSRRGSDLQGPSIGSSQPPQEFFCLFNPCKYTCGRKADLERHVMVTHNRDNIPRVDCDFPGCHRRGYYGFTRKDKMRDHQREVHKVDIPKRLAGKRDSVTGYEGR